MLICSKFLTCLSKFYQSKKGRNVLFIHMIYQRRDSEKNYILQLHYQRQKQIYIKEWYCLE